MKINIDGKITEIQPGQKFISGGKVFGLCSKCMRVIRLDGWTHGLHICK